ncbi:MAG: hypothetical protein KDC53_17340 [Saprospiraceae bacterium]|nr:hypothetical protein [Saprospiraceae bacterium]
MKSITPSLFFHTCTFLFFWLSPDITHTQNTWYVIEGGAGTADGTSWVNATGEVQEAIDSAGTGDQIWVAAGMYYPTKIFDSDGSGSLTPREKTIYISKNIAMYGGFSGVENSLDERDWQSNPTILDGNFNLDTMVTNNAYHVLYFDGKINGDIDGSCILRGFQITGGVANGSGENTNGAGIYLNGMDAGNCSPRIIDCQIYTNVCAGRGGGIYCNAINGQSSAEIVNSIFYKNLAQTAGGALSNSGVNGICMPRVVNVTFYNNKAANGGAILNSGAGGTCAPRFTNSIIWDNDNGMANLGGASPVITHCIYDDGMTDATTILPVGAIDGGNNLDTYPDFADSANYDLRLSTFSPAINAGVNDSLPPDVQMDLSGASRVIFGTVDIGANEYFRCPQSGSPVYVDSATISSVLTGLTWDSAFTSLQWAIDLACQCTDGLSHPSIWVAKGTYYPSRAFDADNNNSLDERERTFYIDKNLKLYGGFAGDEVNLQDRDWNQNPTVLSGDLDLNDVLDDFNAFHVLYFDGTENIMDTTCKMDGFQVIMGNANGSSDNATGGGARLDGSFAESFSVIVNNCRFSNNSAKYGGAVHNHSTASTEFTPIISNTTFSNNSATFEGGAIYAEGSQGENFYSLRNCSFINNSAATNGGAINNVGSFSLKCSPSIHNCSFMNNSANEGGAIYNNAFEGYSSPILVNCLFTDNYSTTAGGVIYNHGRAGESSPVVLNCSFMSNSATEGGAVYNNELEGGTSTPSIVNSIFWKNADEIFNNGGTPTLINCIFDDGSIDGNVGLPSGTIDGGNNLDTYPEFVDSANHDLRLMTGSPGINAGITDSIPADVITDLAGVRRILLGSVDIGAFEYFKCPQTQKPIYVDGSNTMETQTGLNWDSAFADLQWAIDLACECPEGTNYPPIWVAKGTYYPSRDFDANENGSFEVNGKERTFYFNKNLQIYGGFRGTETELGGRDWTLNPTILSGDLDLDGTSSGQNAYHVLFIDGTSSAGVIDSTFLLDGLRIVLGNANGSLVHSYGGGAYLDGRYEKVCNPSIVNCTFNANNALSLGGAIYNDGADSGESSPRITNSSFNDNSAYYGGAIANNAGNFSIGGISSPTILNSSFYQNSATYYGGAIYNDGFLGESSPFVISCIFSHNSSDDGSAIFNFGSTSGESSPSILNSLFFNNSTGTGGVISNFGYDEGTSSPLIISCSFTKNMGSSIHNSAFVGSCAPHITNSILYGNSMEIYNEHDANPKIDHSIIKGSGGSNSWVSSYGTDGGGNLDVNPLFAEALSGNLHLLPYSPAINAGDNASLSVNDTLDLDGNARIVDSVVDMGAYENPEGDCPENPVLDARYSPLDGSYPAGTSITLMGQVEISNNGNVVLDAPNVDIDPIFNLTTPGLLEIKTVGCN